MAIDSRRELRQDISPMAAQTLDAVSLATGQTKQDLVRQILDKWAEAEIHRSTLVVRFNNNHGKPRNDAERGGES